MRGIDYDALLAKHENVTAVVPQDENEDFHGAGRSDVERARRYIANVTGSPEGQRNDTLNRLAFHVLELFPGLTQEEHRQLLLEYNDKCSPPLPRREAESTIQSAWDGCDRKRQVGAKQTPPFAGTHYPKVDASSDGDTRSALAKECWPAPLPEAAFHGLAGEIVHVIEPQSEADPAALLVQILVAFGNIIGRSAYWRVGGDLHFANLFAVLVGRSARARKGTSWGEIRRLLKIIDECWVDRRVQTGLSSGEGLIWAVRDPILHIDPRTREQRLDDPGVEDKRLLILEPEFAQVLRQCERSGNTLSAVVRLAWERGSLTSLTKNARARATHAHISMIGHITKQELLRYLTTTEAASGFANRFLWVLVKRSKVLPDGGQLKDCHWDMFGSRLRDAVEFSKGVQVPIVRDKAAGELWHRAYEDLTADREGLAATICARAEAQTMRLAMLYALLDRSPMVCIEHLQAALALWRYCEASAECIFGSALGDPTADEIAEALKRASSGLTRTEINNLFGRHKASHEIGRALGVLSRAGLAVSAKEETGGRATERWFWHEHGKAK
jgi:hypothetical protein